MIIIIICSSLPIELVTFPLQNYLNKIQIDRNLKIALVRCVKNFINGVAFVNITL